MEHQPPHPNAENMVNYWVFRKQEALHSLECAIRNLDYFENKKKENDEYTRSLTPEAETP